jgi:phytoene dehydrogenase-like protein
LPERRGLQSHAAATLVANRADRVRRRRRDPRARAVSSPQREAAVAAPPDPAHIADDATAAIEAQIERLAPGFRDRILARHVRSATQMEAHNANYVRGEPDECLRRVRIASARRIAARAQARAAS